MLGYRVMETVGREITEINFSRGFAIELGSTLSVVLASVVGLSPCHLTALRAGMSPVICSPAQSPASLGASQSTLSDSTMVHSSSSTR